MPSATEATPYGLRTRIWGYFTPEEALAWGDDYRRIVSSPTRPARFGQLVDLREQKAYPPETNAIIQEMMTYVRQNGLERSAVILNSSVTKMQITRLAKEAGMYAWERYINAAEHQDWERVALDWIEKGIDPDK
jgi:hypothetical protein